MLPFPLSPRRAVLTTTTNSGEQSFSPAASEAMPSSVASSRAADSSTMLFVSAVAPLRITIRSKGSPETSSV